ncbi:uncharacterized protein LOC126975469 [Leptidea sinapis]|uniref:uncharacterized protein LOC126975469 n=1 Tax=Leptidea sinapis TaxID=189913 RepID=UPI0021C2C358|nr:uncharacterized protein LOC126975469 [Leptidea sinapis]
MFHYLLSRLENKSHPLLGPTLWGLQSWGIWQPRKGLFTKIYNIIHFVAILFVLSQYVELWFIRSNLEMAMRNVSVSMLSTVCVVKAITFIIWQKYWRAIINFVSNTEKNQMARRDFVTNKIIKRYTSYCRKITLLYWVLTFATVLTVILAPLASFLSSSEYRNNVRNGFLPHPEIMSSWAPFDKTHGYGYWVLVIEHVFICFYGGGIVANYDTNAVVLMSFFKGQLEILKTDCSRLFDNEDPNLSCHEIITRIKRCHNHHVNLVK